MAERCSATFILNVTSIFVNTIGIRSQVVGPQTRMEKIKNIYLLSFIPFPPFYF